MKTLIIILLSGISCHSQNFMMKMDVTEVYKDTTISNNRVRVVWRISREGSLELLWEDSVLHFTKKRNSPTMKQSRTIRKIFLRYQEYQKHKEYDKYIKLQSLYMNRKNEVFFITIYMYEGVRICINRLGERYPHYFFVMVI